jgi:hypothetical protein
MPTRSSLLGRNGNHLVRAEGDVAEPEDEPGQFLLRVLLEVLRAGGPGSKQQAEVKLATKALIA